MFGRQLLIFGAHPGQGMQGVQIFPYGGLNSMVDYVLRRLETMDIIVSLYIHTCPTRADHTYL